MTNIKILLKFQIEFEGSKHEIRHLQEEVDVLNQQVMEQTNLKKIAEKQAAAWWRRSLA